MKSIRLVIEVVLGGFLTLLRKPVSSIFDLRPCDKLFLVKEFQDVGSAKKINIDKPAIFNKSSGFLEAAGSEK